MEATDIKKRLSGGSSNNDPNAALGGEISLTEIVNNSLQNLMDNVTADQRVTGSIEYRCFYYANTHATETLANAVVYIAAQTPAADTAIAIGLDPAGIGDGETTGVATTIPDEGTAPAAVVFTAPDSAGAGLTAGDLAPGDVIAVWVRRTVDVGAAPASNDPFTLRITGDPT